MKAENLALALYALKKSDFRYGKYVLITGVTNDGLLIGRLAKDTGAAGVVFAVSCEADKAKAESLGFTAWLDGADSLESLIALTEGRKYDITIETAGTPEAYALFMKAAKRGGCAILLKALAEPLSCHICDSIRDQIHFIGVKSYDEASLAKAKRMIASGAVKEASI